MSMSITEPELGYTDVHDTTCYLQTNEKGEKMWHCSQFVTEKIVRKTTRGIPGIYQVSEKSKSATMQILNLKAYSDKEFQRIKSRLTNLKIFEECPQQACKKDYV